MNFFEIKLIEVRTGAINILQLCNWHIDIKITEVQWKVKCYATLRANLQHLNITET